MATHGNTLADPVPRWCESCDHYQVGESDSSTMYGKFALESSFAPVVAIPMNKAPPKNIIINI